MYIGLHVKYPLLLSDFNETLIFSTGLRKIPNTKFYGNLFSGIRVVPCGRTDRGKDMTKLIVVFRNFADSPKNWKRQDLQ